MHVVVQPLLEYTTAQILRLALHGLADGLTQLSVRYERFSRCFGKRGSFECTRCWRNVFEHVRIVAPGATIVNDLEVATPRSLSVGNFRIQFYAGSGGSGDAGQQIFLATITTVWKRSICGYATARVDPAESRVRPL